ncbi:MarR family winged helix-turn-helix transcriptional regulator [Siccirubricoccus sp. KC 17139]|uniref:MarR family winged helix-turn-helix transcriptional regulator n=1 Tax=Siccirubricoccus soli TaxID=2899147 RepID=A0ABT1D5Y8_9PROT|nr:MarR family winged helix-turn-helix transcriptional regulator [Siccirubricoccus soli]MCO6417326.1 MarR family winged helix-turn-helix transcriptional regulator [Siccirubricoccus soli]MCP2683461.1 MarR family winged helix-turn-helix transcriptional regulator [Siccirubricoccus soli]
MSNTACPRFRLTSTLLQAGRLWRRLAQRVLAEHGISQARAAALLWVGRLGGGVRQVTLASHLGVTGAAIVRLLDELCATGLIERRGDPGDRRVNGIWLTAAGELRAAQIEAALAELRAQVLGEVSDADVAATLRVFDALGQASGAAPREAAMPRPESRA